MSFIVHDGLIVTADYIWLLLSQLDGDLYAIPSSQVVNDGAGLYVQIWRRTELIRCCLRDCSFHTNIGRIYQTVTYVRVYEEKFVLLIEGYY